jgi:hypothetical protein
MALDFVAHWLYNRRVLADSKWQSVFCARPYHVAGKEPAMIPNDNRAEALLSSPARTRNRGRFFAFPTA